MRDGKKAKAFPPACAMALAALLLLPHAASANGQVRAARERCRRTAPGVSIPPVMIHFRAIHPSEEMPRTTTALPRWRRMGAGNGSGQTFRNDLRSSRIYINGVAECSCTYWHLWAAY